MAAISNSKFQTTAATTGNFDSDAAGTVNAGATINNSQVRPGTLSAKFIVEAETDTLTISALWQVSDGSNPWVNVAYAPNNPAAVALATGTAGDDAVVTVAVPAPEAVAGWRFVRAAAVSGVATGAATDTYSIAYSYIRN